MMLGLVFPWSSRSTLEPVYNGDAYDDWSSDLIS